MGERDDWNERNVVGRRLKTLEILGSTGGSVREHTEKGEERGLIRWVTQDDDSLI